MSDPGTWPLLVDIIVVWASLLLLFAAFVAGAAAVRRGQGLRAARVLSDEAGGSEPGRDVLRQGAMREEPWERPQPTGVAGLKR